MNDSDKDGKAICWNPSYELFWTFIPLLLGWLVVLCLMSLTAQSSLFGTKPGAYWPGSALRYSLDPSVWEDERRSGYATLARASLVRAGLVAPGTAATERSPTSLIFQAVEFGDPEAVVDVSWSEVEHRLLRIGIGPADSDGRVALDLELVGDTTSGVISGEVVASVSYTKDGSDWSPSGDAVRLVRVEPFTFCYILPTGLRTITLDMDEEALAAWFLDVLERYARIERDSKGVAPFPVIELTDDDATRLVRAVTELVKFRLGGARPAPDGTAVAEILPQPRELASAIRWPLWVYGTDEIASSILWAIYVLAAAAVLQLGIRVGLACRLGPDRLYRLLFKKEAVDGSLEKEEAVELAMAIWEGRRWFVTTIEVIIPSLGFIGTILGLGSAFGSVGIISQIEVVQRQSLMSVLLTLTTAFSTTFCALIVSSLFVLPLNAMVCSWEDRRLLRAAAE